MAEYRRRLPHFQPEGEYLFVTWRLHGSLPVAPADVSYATSGHAFVVQGRALNQRRGALWLSDTRVARHVADTILDGERQQGFYESQVWVIMPTHVLLLILPQLALPKITHWIKGRTAREANRLLGREGEPFWQHESYDHWVRSQRELHRIAAYIEENPVSAGLAATPEDWPWSSATRAS
jgi:REP element-mobilizing transposase RayT